MQQHLKQFLNRYFASKEATVITSLLIVLFTIVTQFGHILAPLLASVVIAYILERWRNNLERLKIGKACSLFIIYSLFISFMLYLILIVSPQLWRQFTNLFNEIPKLIPTLQKTIVEYSQKYPGYISAQQLENILQSTNSYLEHVSKFILSNFIYVIPNIVNIMIYAVLVPILVFFLLKDGNKFSLYFNKVLPNERSSLQQIWGELNHNIGRYISGKFTEMVIIWSITFMVFLYFKLNYSMLLSVLVGASVFVPYVGIVLVTVPVVLVGLMQLGLSSEFVYLMLSHLVVQIIDGNVLVPLLFSEAVALHPIVIILAILFFGGIWGIWGVFFAIPLASLIKALINFWPVTLENSN